MSADLRYFRQLLQPILPLRDVHHVTSFRRFIVLVAEPPPPERDPWSAFSNADTQPYGVPIIVAQPVAGGAPTAHAASARRER